MSLSPIFRLPTDGLTYSRDIFQRVADLIEFDIWQDLDQSQFRKWLNNFVTPEERYFAACVLDGLIYRPKDQTIALVKQLFGRVLPDLTRLDPSPLGCIDDWEERLARASDPGLRLVIAVRESDPPTKSAHYVARLMKREFTVREKWIIRARDILPAIEKGIRFFVFIDDFLATGDQFGRFLSEQPVRLLRDCYSVCGCGCPLG